MLLLTCKLIKKSESFSLKKDLFFLALKKAECFFLIKKNLKYLKMLLSQGDGRHIIKKSLIVLKKTGLQSDCGLLFF